MSLLLAIHAKDYILMGADSRESEEIDGKKYAINDSCQKVRQINNMVIFGGGSRCLMETVVTELEKHDNITIEDVQETARLLTGQYIEFRGEKWIKERYTGKDGRNNLLGLVIGMYEGSETVLYHLHVNENYDIQRLTNNTDTILEYTLGIHQERANKIMKVYSFKTYIEVYRKVYKRMSCEEIGGNLTVYKISKDGIKPIMNEPIPDGRVIKFKQISLAENGHCEMTGALLAGSIVSQSSITGGTITIGDEENVFKCDSVNGISLGSSTPSTAPFRVLPNGELTATKATIKGDITSGSTITGSTIEGGTIQTAASGKRQTIDINGFVTYDSNENKRIEIANDSTGGSIDYYKTGNKVFVAGCTNTDFTISAINQPNGTTGGDISLVGP